MNKYIAIILILFSCEMPDNSDSPGPVISFYKGIDPYYYQPTFVFSDTTIKGKYRKTVSVHFAAAATIKRVEVKLNGISQYEKTFENHNYYNHKYMIDVKPEILPQSFVVTFSVTDYNDRSVEKSITINYIP